MYLPPLLLGAQNRPLKKTWRVVFFIPQPYKLRAQQTLQGTMEFGDWRVEERTRRQQLFPVKHCGVKTGKGSFVKGSGKVQVERVWLTLGGKPLPRHEQFFQRGKERIPKMKRKKNVHEMGLCYFLNMSLNEGFWQPHRTPFTDYLQCVLIFNPQLLKTAERNLCSGCSFVKILG